jgi:hypothetical protein
MQPNESTGGKDLRHDNSIAADSTLSARDYTYSTPKTTAPHNPGVGKIRSIYQGLVELLDDRRTLPTYVRSKHIAPYTTYGSSTIGRAMDHLAADDECPLHIAEWNDTDSSGSIWRVERRGDE